MTGNTRLLMPRFSTHHSPANGPFGRIGCKIYAPGGGLVRHRRGRVPHVVVATAEPTVGRIASIAQGTLGRRLSRRACANLSGSRETTGSNRRRNDLVDLAKQGYLFEHSYLPAMLAEP